MKNAVHERIQAKTRDSQLFEIFVNHFEFSPKTAEATIHTVCWSILHSCSVKG
jgi:hypothetical protein